MLENDLTKPVLRLEYKIPENLSDFDPDDFIKAFDEYIEKTVSKNKRIAVSASGGIDSTVLAFLLHKIVGDRLYLFFIDDGFRRTIRGKEEWEVTADIFKDFTNFNVIDAKDRFLPLFDSLSDGEVKRKTFREIYTSVSNEFIEKIEASYVADGTIYPDIFETNGPIKFKTQHNINLPYAVTKLEPLASLYKPHVRRVAKALGLPNEVVFKIPCPGPAQLLRVVGKVNSEKLELSKIATDLVEQMVEQYCEKIWGERFRYDETTGVRHPFQMFGATLDNWLKELNGINESINYRFDKSIKCYKMKNCSTYVESGMRISSEPLCMPVIWLESNDELGFDDILTMQKYIWSMFGYPRLLYQVYDSNRTDGYLVAIRSVISEDATTAQPMKIDFDYLSKIGEEITKSSNLVAKVGYDMGVKPPATIEFE